MLLCTAERLAKPIGHVYVLACKGGRFYVGFSRNLERRIKQHFDGEGAKFTKAFKPLRLVDSAPANGERDEYAVWVYYARRYGAAQVGGWNEALANLFGFEWRRY